MTVTTNYTTLLLCIHLSFSDNNTHTYIVGNIGVFDFYQEEKQNGGDGYNWTKELLDQLSVYKAFCYARSHCEEALAKYYKDYIHQKRCAVIGTQYPWAEASLIGTIYISNLFV